MENPNHRGEKRACVSVCENAIQRRKLSAEPRPKAPHRDNFSKTRPHFQAPRPTREWLQCWDRIDQAWASQKPFGI
jgi:hypothetical protein